MKSFQSFGLSALLATSAYAAPLSRRATGKAGIAWSWANTAEIESGSTAFTDAINALGGKVSWSLNWETWRPTELPEDVKFHPMLQTMDQLAPEGKAWLDLQKRIEEGCDTVHFLNEPDLKGVSAEEAAGKWKDQMLPLREQHGVKLISPGVSSSEDPGKGAEWLDAFMGQLAENEKPDGLSVHFYSNADLSNAEEIPKAQSYLAEMHGRYEPALPLIVTEVACTSRDSAQVEQFTTEMKNYMESEDFVQQYAFFGASKQPADGYVSPAAQLMNEAGQWTKIASVALGVDVQL